MTVPVTAKIAGVLFLWHWIGMYLRRNIESHPHPSAKARTQRDSIRGLMTIVRAVIAGLATIALIQL